MEIKYDVEAMKASAQSLNQCARELKRLKTQMMGTRSILRSGWRGEAANTFEETYLVPLRDSLSKYSEMIDEFNGLLRQFVAMYAELTAQAENLKIY